MQQVSVSNIIMSMKSPNRSIAISSRCSFCEIVKTELGPSRGVEGNMSWSQSAWMILRRNSPAVTCLSVAKSMKLDSF